MNPDQSNIESQDGSKRVTYDLPCANCGYNLRTLSYTGDCPECAHPVAVTLTYLRTQLVERENTSKQAGFLISASLWLWAAGVIAFISVAGLSPIPAMAYILERSSELVIVVYAGVCAMFFVTALILGINAMLQKDHGSTWRFVIAVLLNPATTIGAFVTVMYVSH